MATTKSIIGYLPVPRQDYVEGTSYGLYNLVNMYGCVFISLAADNTNVPATLDSSGKPVPGTNWGFFVDNSDGYQFGDRMIAIERDFGQYSGVTEQTLSVGTSGRYVNTSGSEVSSSSYAISAKVSLTAGNIYLFKSSSALAAAVSAFARVVTKTYEKVIGYTYTYDDAGKILTATADYDTTLVYTYTYDSEGNLESITDASGTVVTELPATRAVTESFYDPLFRSATSAIPTQGYYVFPCPTDMDVVISGLTADITGGSLLAVKYGLIASIITNYLGVPGQRILTQTFAQLEKRILALEKAIDNMGDLKVNSIDLYDPDGLTIGGRKIFLSGEGVPSATTIPDQQGKPAFYAQRYTDLLTGEEYRPKGLSAVSDWVQS